MAANTIQRRPYRVRRPGESITLVHLYNWLAKGMWGASAAATALAISPVALLIALLLNVPVGRPATMMGILLAGALGLGIQYGLSIAERPALRGNFSPLVVLALVLDFAANLGGAYLVLPFLTTAFGWTMGLWGWLVYPVAAGLLTLGPELGWALALHEQKGGNR